MVRLDPDSYGPKEKRLLVEGEDDQHFFWNLLEAHGITSGVRVQDQKGYSQIRKQLPILLRAGNETHLGIVVDADTGCRDRWRAIRDVLRKAGYVDVPDDIEPGGTIVGLIEPQPPVGAEPANKTIVGVWIMPNNNDNGALEEFVASLIPPTDSLWPRAISAVEGIPPGERVFGSTDVMKAKMHTWLAWQEQPGQPMGRAIKKGALQHQTELAVALVDWVRRLFDIPAGT